MVPAGKIASIEAGRAVAACLVVMHHAAMAANDFTFEANQSFLHWGSYGVDFFFVLSGFIIYHVHQDDERSWSAASKYFMRRLRRIYIPYFPITLVLIVAYLALPNLSQSDRDWSVATSITLLPFSGPPALSVAWTLVYEMIFYIFFLTFYMSRQFWFWVSAWVTLVVISSILGGDLVQSQPFATLVNPLVLEFVAGMLAAFLYRRLSETSWMICMMFAIAIVGTFVLMENPHRVLVGIGLAPFVLSIALLERRYRFSLPEWILFLGAASYAIYLVHNPLFSLVARLVSPVQSWGLTFGLCTLIGLAAGAVYHAFFEKPALTFARRRTGHS